MSHAQIEEIVFRAVQAESKDAALVRDAEIGSISVDMLWRKNDEKVAFEIKTTNFFDGFGRATIWKDYVDSVYLVIPVSILPHRQIIDKMPRQVGLITFEFDNDSVRFKSVRQASVALPTRFLESDYVIEKRTGLGDRRATASLVSPKALRIVKYLLMHGKTAQNEIAKETDVSIGMVNKVVSRLMEREIVAYKKRRLALLEPWKLLNEVSWERQMTRIKIGDYYLPEISEVKQAERYLKEICSQRKASYALTLFSGANRYVAYSMRYDAVYSYIEPANSIIELLTGSKGPTEQSIRLELFRVDNPDVLNEAKVIDGLSVCSPAQVLVDIASYGPAGKDVAVELYRKLSEERGPVR